MDFTLIEKTVNEYGCYKLLKSNFYRDYYVIIVQNKRDFACGSFRSTKEGAVFFLKELAEMCAEPNTLVDIIGDYQKQRI